VVNKFLALLNFVDNFGLRYLIARKTKKKNKEAFSNQKIIGRMFFFDSLITFWQW
jgi:hypothetical protein